MQGEKGMWDRGGGHGGWGGRHGDRGGRERDMGRET